MSSTNSVSNNTIYSIIINVIRRKGVSKEDRPYDFLDYSGYDVKGKKCRFKFTKDCENLPKLEGAYTFEIDKRFINRDKSTKYREYWVKNVLSVTPYDGIKNTDNTEDLPF